MRGLTDHSARSGRLSTVAANATLAMGDIGGPPLPSTLRLRLRPARRTYRRPPGTRRVAVVECCSSAWCDRGQERDSQDFKIISAVGSGFAYFRVRGVLQIIGCGVQGGINLHFDTLVRLLLVGCRRFILGWVFFGIVSSRLMLR
eukprot:g58455.t1